MGDEASDTAHQWRKPCSRTFIGIFSISPATKPLLICKQLIRFDALVTPVHNFFLDVFPVAWKLPAFISPWKREAREVGRERRELYMKLLGECEERMAAKEDAAFYMADVLRNQDDLGLEREQVACVIRSHNFFRRLMRAMV